jgi:type I restriction enzyme M protein
VKIDTIIWEKQNVPDAWIDHCKTTIGYSISFTSYFYSYQPPKDLEDIKKKIIQLEKETEGILEKIIND